MAQARLTKKVMENPWATIDAVITEMFEKYPVPPAPAAVFLVRMESGVNPDDLGTTTFLTLPRHTMFSKILRSTALLVTLSFVGLAQRAIAEENPSGPYLSAGYGQFNASVDDIEDIVDVAGDLDSDEDAYKFAFGWRFNPYISAELDYIDLGTPRANFEASGSGGIDDGAYEVDLSGVGGYIIGTLPITIFELSAKLGYYFHDISLDVDFDNVGSGNGDVLDSDQSGEALAYGVGAGVTFIDHINVNLEYELFDIDELDDVYTVWLNAAWRF